MELYPRGPSFPSRALGSVFVFASLAVTVSGMTLLFLGMRSVMEIGGACASGGAYEIARPCPHGVPLAIMAGVWGGVAAFLVYLWQVSSRGVSGFVALAWPALFLSLGWNFLEFGLDSPNGGGLEWGWLICAIAFGLIGAAPLFIAGPAIARGILPFCHRPASNGAGGSSGENPYRRPPMRIPAPAPAPPAAGVPGPVARDRPPDVVRALERLATLRQSGSLTEDEFEQAKHRVLEGE